MNIIIKELEGIATFTQQDGNIIDFRNINEHIFIIDRGLKTLKPECKYKVTIELITETVEECNNENTLPE